MSYRPITDTWLLARPKVKFWGAYPSGFLARARALLGVGLDEPVLHVCAGKVRDYPFEGLGPNDKTLDLDPETKPDFLMDAREIRLEGSACVPACPSGPTIYAPWPAVLIDRPYTEEDLTHYAPCVQGKLPNLNKLLKDCLGIVRPGGQVGVLDYFVPRPPKDGVKFTALISVLVGYGNRMRAYSVFERRAPRTEEQKRRTRRAILGKT
jgi:hypothetical protein